MPATRVSKRELYAFLAEDNEVELSTDVLVVLENADIYRILVDQYVSENRVGGDDIVSFVDQTLEKAKEGYQIVTWYGPNTEAMVVGVRPAELEVID